MTAIRQKILNHAWINFLNRLHSKGQGSRFLIEQ